MKVRILTFILLLAALIGAINGAKASESRQITVSAAISLKNAFTDIGRAFEAGTGISVLLNFGASGSLMEQIRAGAPVDVFASAALKDMDELDRRGLVIRTTRRNFAANSVVLIQPGSASHPITSFGELADPEIRTVAIGNPRTVPAGRYADEVLHHFRLSGILKHRLVYAENVRQVLDYAARGEVDAAIVYSTDALVRADKVRVAAVAPAGSHRPILYPIAVVKGTTNEKAARTFLSFVLSRDGEKILKQYGFKPVK